LVLGSAGGGIAGLGVVGGADKGRGCTGLTTPIGDYFAVDYVAHEMGHQFSANHTFAGFGGSCGGNGVSGTAVEPGSGSSVMAYAGICSSDDLQDHSDPYFSQKSVTEISAYVNGAESNLSSQQQAVMANFDGTDSFQLLYNGNLSTTITRGTNYDATSIQAAIQAITGQAVSVTSVTDAGFVVAFAAAGPVATLSFTNLFGASGSINEIVAGGSTHRGGSSVTTTGNHVPDVSTGGPYTIPARTPFVLDASGSDADGDPLTYLWEQNDNGFVSLYSNTKNSGPLFRVFGTAARYADPNDAYLSPSPGENAATATSWRAFPDLAQVAADNTNAATGTCPTAINDTDTDCFSEYLPTTTRTLHFRVSARDDHPGFGGLGTADATVNVASAAGPFRVTSQAAPATVAGQSALPVTWNVAGTTANGINAANVKISLSVDGGQTFTKVLADSTPNDGSETVTLPRVATTAGRIKVEAVGNVFYDLSHAPLTITDASPAILNGPASADLGAAEVGQAAAPATITITSDGSSAATIGTVAIAGADGGAVAKTQDSCSSATLASGASCTITLRLTPGHAGAQSATVSVPSNDTASPLTIALTGSGTTPPSLGGGTATTATTPTTTTPVPPPGLTDLQRATALAAALGVKTPVLLGTASHLYLFGLSKSSKLGKPKPSKTIAAAVCVGGTCRGKATAKLTLTPRKGKKKSTTLTLVKALK
ncbi:MAG TPA: choice-of-anchor D domain-containing protein, partial [Baekduia sp.]|nr:choice-of-anchor D domain-containing protein [Baekduia sp.]